MYTAVCRHIYLPGLDLLKGWRFASAYRATLENQYLSREQMCALQSDSLRRLLIHAGENVPYYRELFALHSFRPQEISSPNDIRALPILEKDDVRRLGETLKAAQVRGRVSQNATSGSTGLSLRFILAAEHTAWAYACGARGRSWWNLKRGERHLLLLGHPVGSPAETERRRRLKYRLRNCIEFDTFRDIDAARAREIYAALCRWRPKVIYGYGSGIGRLAESLRAQGIRLSKEERPVLVEYTADHMFENERRSAEEVFGSPVISGYGARECGGMAAECRRGNLHWSADHALCEIVRPDGSAVSEHEVGDLVVTPMRNFAMPFIRYRIGDRLSFSNEGCDCGVTLPVVHLHAGRASEIITTSACSSVSSVVFDFINRVDLVKAGVRGIRQFLVEQTALDDFVLHVVRDDPFDPRSVQIFTGQMKRALGQGIRVQVRFVSEIPMEPTGKRRWFKTSFIPNEAARSEPSQEPFRD
jgi:phenylacetate-CoA ligase